MKEGPMLVAAAQKLLAWNRSKLVWDASLTQDDIAEVFAPEFKVMANGRSYEATFETYLAFLNRFRANIAALSYDVQEYLAADQAVTIPLQATVARRDGSVDRYAAIMLLKYNDAGKIKHWQEVYVTLPAMSVG